MQTYDNNNPLSTQEVIMQASTEKTFRH